MFKLQAAADAAGRMPCHRHTALHNLEYVILPIDKSDGCEQAMSRGREFLSRLMQPTNMRRLDFSLNQLEKHYHAMAMGIGILLYILELIYISTNQKL